MSNKFSVYPFYGVGVLNKHNSHEIELKPNRTPKWFSDLTFLKSFYDLEKAKDFSRTLDLFWVRVFIVTYCSNNKVIVREVK